MRKYIFIALLLVPALLIFRVYVYHSDELSLSQTDTTEPEISHSSIPIDISETGRERSLSIPPSELALKADVVVEEEYIEVPQPLSDEPLLLVRDQIIESQSQDTIKYVTEPQFGTPVAITVNTEVNDYVEIPQPLSDEPLYMARQEIPSSQGDSTEIIYLPQPLSDTPLEITVNTEANNYIQIPQPLSDEPLYFERQNIPSSLQ
jgi:hypothetical protein